MTTKNSITFTVWEDDPPLEIQLEPEATLFTVKPGEEMSFAVKNPTKEFCWTVRHFSDGVQLCPDGYGSYEGITIYRNGEVVIEL